MSILKKIALSFMIIISSALNLFAQEADSEEPRKKTSFLLYAGGSSASNRVINGFNFEYNNIYKPSFGLGIRKTISDSLYLDLETGFRYYVGGMQMRTLLIDSTGAEPDVEIKNEINIHYLQLPITLIYNLDPLQIRGGVYAANILERTIYNTSPFNTSETLPLDNKFDFGFEVGLEYNINFNRRLDMLVGASYYQSFTSIEKDSISKNKIFNLFVALRLR